MSKTAREIMTTDCTCVGENDTIIQAAEQLARLNVGAMPICGEDNRLKGMLTDRDIVVKALAQGKDPASTRAGELGEGKPVTVGADDSLQDALRTMAQYKVRRLPVVDGHDLVGIIAVADIAREVDDDAEEILHTMSRYQIRRLPVIDGHQLVGIVAMADVARALPDAKVGDLLEAVSID